MTDSFGIDEAMRHARQSLPRDICMFSEFFAASVVTRSIEKPTGSCRQIRT